MTLKPSRVLTVLCWSGSSFTMCCSCSVRGGPSSVSCTAAPPCTHEAADSNLPNAPQLCRHHKLCRSTRPCTSYIPERLTGPVCRE